MFGSGGIQLFHGVAQACATPDRSDSQRLLRPEHFPVRTRGREIVTAHNVVIAIAADPEISEEIVRRLNESDFKSQEDQWAL